MEAEIRYYIKVTVQRPGILKENWRYQIGYKFLPIEPPRYPKTGQEAFARRPFTFHPRSPVPQSKKKSSFFTNRSDNSNTENDNNTSSSGLPNTAAAPSIEMSARLPYPAVLTCNKPIPLRLVAKKLADCPEQLTLASFQMDLIGITEVRTHNLIDRKINRWVVVSNASLDIPLTSGPNAVVGSELPVPDSLWKDKPLPNTVAPSFVTCNLSRRYEVELKLGVCWGKAKSGFISNHPQTIYLPLHFASVQVFSGITPPPELLEAAQNHTLPGRATLRIPPMLPPRANSTPASPVSSQNQHQTQTQAQRPSMPQRPPQDPLYPPQLQPGQTVPPYDDAPPSYNEAVAENVSGPFDGLQSRPAYSGVTNENAPSQMPEKS